MRRLMLVAALSALSLTAFSLGCGEAEELIDCQAICENKKDCVDRDYDVTACRDECEDRSDEDESFRDAAHQCEACLDNRACAEQSECLDECPIL